MEEKNQGNVVVAYTSCNNICDQNTQNAFRYFIITSVIIKRLSSIGLGSNTVGSAANILVYSTYTQRDSCLSLYIARWQTI